VRILVVHCWLFQLHEASACLFLKSAIADRNRTMIWRYGAAVFSACGQILPVIDYALSFRNVII
jgi:hypothetical protein